MTPGTRLKGYLVKHSQPIQKKAYDPSQNVPGAWSASTGANVGPGTVYDISKEMEHLNTSEGQDRQKSIIAGNQGALDYMSKGYNWANAMRVPARSLVSQPFHILNAALTTPQAVAGLVSPQARARMWDTDKLIYGGLSSTYDSMGLGWDPRTSDDAKFVLEKRVQPGTELAYSLALSRKTPFKNPMANKVFQKAMIWDDAINLVGQPLKSFLLNAPVGGGDKNSANVDHIRRNIRKYNDYKRFLQGTYKYISPTQGIPGVHTTNPGEKVFKAYDPNTFEPVYDYKDKDDRVNAWNAYAELKNKKGAK